jgi:hypothetical protein
VGAKGWNIIAATLGTIAGVISGMAILMSGLTQVNAIAFLGAVAATACGAAWLVAAFMGE